ncbi:hypothetical protein AK812_SmicGene13398 [Symbiodinium microadriaticum]|uniref:Uncharacterized protein n=1 Tax=Symbiodinium microadriaticum TaxID=2951 RepID=A0A1Q9E881_SYMMI|nr:hypothetical protein AK812_SmicGene13398 [Symbiodinium microadriaticum]
MHRFTCIFSQGTRLLPLLPSLTHKTALMTVMRDWPLRGSKLQAQLDTRRLSENMYVGRTAVMMLQFPVSTTGVLMKLIWCLLES